MLLYNNEVQQKRTSIKQHTSQSSKTQMVQDSHSVLNIIGQKKAYDGNLHENVKEIDINELFNLKITTYICDNFSVHMPQLQSNKRCKRYPYIKSPVMFLMK